MDGAELLAGLVELEVTGGPDAGRPVRDDEQRGPRPRFFISQSKPAQASVDSDPSGARCKSTGLPVVVIPQARSTGSAFASLWYLKWLASRKRYSSSMSARERLVKASSSSLIAWQTRLTVDFDTVASGPSASASVASMSRTVRRG